MPKEVDYGEPLTDLERANLAREFTIIGGGIQEGVAYIRMRDTQGNVHTHPRPYWREQATRIESEIQEGLKLRAAVKKLEEQSDGMNFNRYQDRWMARTYTLATYQDTLPVGDFDSLAAALIALAGENKE